MKPANGLPPWFLPCSRFFTEDQKQRIKVKLANRITDDGVLLVKSQAARTQLGNKSLVIDKMNELITQALLVKKARMSTKPSKASIEKRIESKKRHAQNKLFRKKFNQED